MMNSDDNQIGRVNGQLTMLRKVKGKWTNDGTPLKDTDKAFIYGKRNGLGAWFELRPKIVVFHSYTTENYDTDEL